MAGLADREEMLPSLTWQRIERRLLPLDATRADLALRARAFHVWQDRQKLLAIIEAAFGTCAPFNKLVREVFVASFLPDAANKRAGKRSSLRLRDDAKGGAALGTAPVVVFSQFQFSVSVSPSASVAPPERPVLAFGASAPFTKPSPLVS